MFMKSPIIYSEHLELCGSTMEVARERLEVCAEDFGIITATDQTAGRGRRGNTWKTPKGGFLGTIWIKTDLDAAELSGLSLAVGVLLVRTLRKLGAALWLKWPNDLVTLDSRKVGGILVEVGATKATLASQNQFVLIGIGVNSKAPEELSLTAAGLCDLIDRNAPLKGLRSISQDNWGITIRDALSEELPVFWDEFSTAGLKSFLSEWRDCCLNIGKIVEFTRGDGRERALFLDVGEAGEAIINVNGKIEKFFSGEIHTVREVKI